MQQTETPETRGGGHDIVGSRRPTKIDPRKAGIAALVVMGALFLFLVYSGAHVRELVDPDAMDYAQIARHLSRGEGFTTSWVRPLSLGQVQNISHHPELLRAPLHPMVMSILFRAFGADHRAAAWAGGIAYLVSLPLVYLLALRLFNRRTALLALGLYGVNHFVLHYAVSGLEISLATCFITGLLLVAHLYLKAEEPSPALAAGCGALLGLAVLTNYIYAALLLPVALLLLLRDGRKRWGAALLSVAACLVVMLPWAVRNARVAGSPVATISTADFVTNTGTHRDLSVYRKYLEKPPSAIVHALKHPKEIWRKVRPVALSLYADSDLNVGGPLVLAFFVAAIFLRFKAAGLRELRLMHYAWLGLMAIVMCLLAAHPRVVVPLSPLAIIVASACFLTAADRLVDSVQGPKRKRRALTWSIGGLLAVSWFPVFANTVTMETRDTAQTDELRKVAGALKERKVGTIYTDQPWTLAWYGDMDAIWLPEDEDEMLALEAAVGPIQGALLSPFISRTGPGQGLSDWAGLYVSALRGGAQGPFAPVASLGETGDWLLFRRVPEGAAQAESPSAPGR